MEVDDISDFIKENYTSALQHLPQDCVNLILEYSFFNVHRYAYLLFNKPQQDNNVRQRQKRYNPQPASITKDKQLHPSIIKVLFGYYAWDTNREIHFLFPNLLINSIRSYDCDGEVIKNIFLDDKETSIMRQLIPIHDVTSLCFDGFTFSTGKTMMNPPHTLSYLLSAGTNFSTMKTLVLTLQKTLNDECWKIISRCERLEYLDLTSTSVTLQGLQEACYPKQEEDQMQVDTVDAFPNLKTLILNGTEQNRSDNHLASLIQGWKRNNKLERLEIGYTTVDDMFLYDLIRDVKSIQKLVLDNCKNITDTGVRGISRNDTLTSIDISHTNMTDQVVEILKCASLRELVASSTTASTQAVEKLLKANKFVRIKITGVMNHEDQCVGFTESDPHPSSLKHLDLSYNVLSKPEKLQGIVGFRVLHQQLVTLTLSRCLLVDECCQVLFANSWPLLESLDLSFSSITDASIKYLQTNVPALTKLNVSNTQIGDESATILSSSATITDLDVSATKITGVGALLLLAAQPHTILSTLIMDQLSTGGQDFLEGHPITNTSLTKLSLANNSIKNGGAKVLFDMKNDDNLLVDISLSGCSSVGDEAANWLTRNTNLDSLNLRRTNVTDQMRSKLITKCTQIQEILL
jgi:hypothetical protein